MGTFLQSSATYDSNDLSSVVQEGGHWCICAWAWASAVSRDPVNFEGIQLDCERTNARLRNVYELYISESRKMTSPSGAQYAVEQALESVNKICDPSKNTPAPTPAPAPAPAPSTVTKAAEPTDTETLVFKMTMKNVEFTKLNEASKEALTVKCRDMIAEQAGVSKSAVSVTMSQGSVIITAEIKAPKGSASFVQTDMQKAELSSKVLTVAKTIPG